MSQERTRFPTQPKDVRRSAKSNKDMAVPGKGFRGGGGKDQDKPSGPPPRPRTAKKSDDEGDQQD